MAELNWTEIYGLKISDFLFVKSDMEFRNTYLLICYITMVTLIINVVVKNVDPLSIAFESWPRFKQWPKQKLDNVLEQSPCKVKLIHNLTNSRMEKIQEERRSVIRKTCNLCRRNVSFEECSHIATGSYDRMFEKLMVDDKHKVACECFRFRLLGKV